MDIETKFDLLLREMKNICKKIDDKFEKVDERFEKIDERFAKLENRFDNLENRFDNLEKRFNKFEEKNESEHKSIYNMISSLNSAFLRFEAKQADHTEKINYLLEADKERKEHQIIYAHEFTHLNDLVAQNSFRISNLEKHSQQNYYQKTLYIGS